MSKIEDNNSVAGNIIPEPNDIENIDMSNPEEGTKEQIKAMLSAKENKKKYANRLNVMRQSQYYFCVSFLSEAQKNEFLEKTNWITENSNDRFIDGLELAEMLNIQITEDNGLDLPDPEFINQFKKGG